MQARTSPLRVFVSHGKHDAWLAGQIARRIRDCGASVFLDETDIKAGDQFENIIQNEIAGCSELIVLLTPWSHHRRWVWVEVGAAWGQGKRIVALLYGLSRSDLEKKGGLAVLASSDVRDLNEMERYLDELQARANGGLS